MKWNFLYQITAASRTPDKGATAPKSPFCLSSTEFVEPPPSEQNSWVPHCAQCSHKHISAATAAIFRVMLLLQQYNGTNVVICDVITP